MNAACLILACMILPVHCIEPVSTLAGGIALLGAGYKWWQSRLCGFDAGFKDKFDQYVDQHVFGQHIASLMVAPEMRAHLESIGSQSARSKALGMAFHGGTGTGKTYLSTFIEKSLFAGHSHKIIFPGTDYQDPSKVHTYRLEMKQAIEGAIRKCPHALFVFMDSHLIAPGVLDVLVKFLDYGTEDINGLDFSKAIYIFQSNLCDKDINVAMTDHIKAGLMRTRLDHTDMQQVLQKCVGSTQGASESVLAGKHLVYRIPFLPLGREEVLKCAGVFLRDLRERGQALGKWQGLYWSSDVEHFLTDTMRFLGLYSTVGCKTMDQKVRTYIEGPLSRANKRGRKCDMKDFELFTMRGELRQIATDCFTHHKDTLSLSMHRGHVCVSLEADFSARLAHAADDPENPLPPPKCLNARNK